MFKRNKYDYEFRLQCIESILSGSHSLSSLSKEKGVELSNLRLWMMFYEHYGEAGLHPRKKQHYDIHFKLSVLEAIDKEFLSLRSACVRFNIPSDSMIISWRKAYRSDGAAGLMTKPKGRPAKMKDRPIKRKAKKSPPLSREEELLQENEYLKLQLEILKKYQALVQVGKKRES